jgi:hypothetical protein
MKSSQSVATSAAGTFASENAASLRYAYNNEGAMRPAVTRGPGRGLLTDHFASSTMNKTVAEKIIRANGEAMMSRFEPIDRILDPFAQNALAVSHGIALLKYIPCDQKTVYTNFISPLDLEVTERIQERMAKIAGNMTLSIDGVTVLKSSHLLYTLSKGSISLFQSATQLGAFTHVTDREVADGVAKLVALSGK